MEKLLDAFRKVEDTLDAVALTDLPKEGSNLVSSYAELTRNIEKSTKTLLSTNLTLPENVVALESSIMKVNKCFSDLVYTTLRSDNYPISAQEFVDVYARKLGKTTKEKWLVAPNFSISKDGEVTCIHLDQRVPTVRTEKKVLSQFNKALEEAFWKWEPDITERYSNVVLCFIYGVSSKHIRDTDNNYTKKISDLIAERFLTGDSAENVDWFHKTVSAKKDFTDIYIVPRNCFPEWVNKLLNNTF